MRVERKHTKFLFDFVYRHSAARFSHTEGEMFTVVLACWLLRLDSTSHIKLKQSVTCERCNNNTHMLHFDREQKWVRIGKQRKVSPRECARLWLRHSRTVDTLTNGGVRYS